MRARPPKAGRPKGTTTYDQELAEAFGLSVRKVRQNKGISQEDLAMIAEIERSHVGKIERGQHMPTLALILRLARALGVRSALLMNETEKTLQDLDKLR